MHEMSIALEIIEIVKASLPPEPPVVRVERVNLQVGKMSAIVPRSLHFCYEIAVRDTPLAGSRLEIEEVPVVARCNGCGCDWVLESPAFKCPECGGTDIEILSGRELDIVSIEIQEQD